MKIRKFKKHRLTRKFRDTVLGAPLADVNIWLECLGRKVKVAGAAAKNFLQKIGLLGT